MPRQSFVSVRQLRRNFDDGRSSAEGHPIWHNQPGSNPSYSVAICRRGSTLGPGGGQASQFVTGPQIFEGFRGFYHRHSVCHDIKRPRGQADPIILGLEPRLAMCLAQWTARSHAARNALGYYRNHSLNSATLFSKLDSNKLRLNVKNEMTLIYAKFDADLINISKVTSRKTKWPRFGLHGMYRVRQ